MIYAIAPRNVTHEQMISARWNECVRSRIHPVSTGATEAKRKLQKFWIVPTEPTRCAGDQQRASGRAKHSEDDQRFAAAERIGPTPHQFIGDDAIDEHADGAHQK